MQDAFTQYDLDMNEAIINNDVQKAQNALAKLEMILGFQQNFYDSKNQIAQSQLSNNQALDESYHGRYMDMVNQINTEKQREEAIRQFEAQMAYQKERDKVADAQWEKQYKLAKSSSSSGSGGSGGSGGIQVTGNQPTNSKQDAIIGAVGIGATLGGSPNALPKDLGNSAQTQSKSDYYFKNTTNKNGGKDYQPRYINNTKIVKSGYKSAEGYNIWKANGKYYVWNGATYEEVAAPPNTKTNTNVTTSTIKRNIAETSGKSYTI
jgi:hypothetical protein